MIRSVFTYDAPANLYHGLWLEFNINSFLLQDHLYSPSHLSVYQSDHHFTLGLIFSRHNFFELFSSSFFFERLNLTQHFSKLQMLHSHWKGSELWAESEFRQDSWHRINLETWLHSFTAFHKIKWKCIRLIEKDLMRRLSEFRQNS